MKSWMTITLALCLLALCITPTVRADASKDVDIDEDELIEEVPNQKFPPPQVKPVVVTPPVEEDVEDFDDEEFVGFEQVKQAPKVVEEKKEEKPAKPALETIYPPAPPRTNYYLEIIYVNLICIYVINYFYGKKINDQLATKWAESITPILLSNFSKVGEGSQGIGLVKENAFTYRLKATGRINCVGLQATLTLKKRQDLYTVVTGLLFPIHDTVTIDILMNDDAMDPFVFAIMPKKEEKKSRRNLQDLAVFTGTAVHPVTGSLVCISEVGELTTALLTEEVNAALRKEDKLVNFIHFSDQLIASDKYKNSLRFVYRVIPEEPERLSTLYKLTIHYIDLVSRTRLSKMAKAKVDKNRTKIEEEKAKATLTQRQEAAQQRKLEKIQKEKESLSPEAQQKLDEKLAKRELKKKQNKFKLIR